MSMQECENHHSAWSGKTQLDLVRENVMRVVYDLESWRAVETDFDSRKLIDDATKKLREALKGDTK
jgi:hypothetical protein